MTIRLQKDETRIIRVFSGEEPDPHRARFWRIVVSSHGLVLEPDYEPNGEALRSEASWHDLHDMMSVRAELIQEIEELRAEVDVTSRDLERLRTHWRRLKRIVNARQVDVGDATVLDLYPRLMRQQT